MRFATLPIFIMLMTIGCYQGKVRPHIYRILVDDRTIIVGRFMHRPTLNTAEKSLRKLDGLALEILWDSKGNDLFEFVPDSENESSMIIKGNIRIFAPRFVVDLGELKFLKAPSSHGMIAKKNSGWVVDPSQIDDFIKRANPK